MTPTEMKAAAFDKIVRVVKKLEGDHFLLPAILKIDRIVDKLARDEKRFWKRMAKFDRDIMTGKDRSFQLTREWVSMDDKESSTEFWNPDTKTWERQSPLPEAAAGGE